jgi:Xaa-Pro aminopeptidase
MQHFTSFTGKANIPPGLFAVLMILCLGGLPAGAAETLEKGSVKEARAVGRGVRLPVSETQSRRARLVELLRRMVPGEEDRENREDLVLLAGARSSDLAEFRQTANFYYLTGLELPGAVLVIHLDGAGSGEILYLPARSLSEDRWNGPAIGPGKADPKTGEPDSERRASMRLTGFDGTDATLRSALRDIAELEADLSELGKSAPRLFVEGSGAGETDPVTQRMILQLDGRAAPIEDLNPILAEMRRVKSPSEIDAIRRAVTITCESQIAAMHAMAPGLMEYEIEAVVEYGFTRQGARFAAFPTVVGAGENSCIMHYSRNDSVIESPDLVVIDAGAEYQRYAADITRTLPASGRFQPDQQRLYEAVLDAQLAGIALVKPGATIRDINAKVTKIIKMKGLAEYIVHGCCHYVGLDVHDVGDHDAPFKPGVVLTVEPGLYVPEQGVGVRIEDTVLVTEAGYEVLSACVPKAVDAIESEMAKKESGVSSTGSAARPH